MQLHDAPQPAARFQGLPSATSGAIAASFDSAVQVGFGGPMGDDPDHEAPESIDVFPAWLAGGIIVGLSSIFWVGLLTILGWIV